VNLTSDVPLAPGTQGPLCSAPINRKWPYFPHGTWLEGISWGLMLSEISIRMLNHAQKNCLSGELLHTCVESWYDTVKRKACVHCMMRRYSIFVQQCPPLRNVFFSHGRQLLSFTQNRLTGPSIQRFLCLGDWSRKDIVGDAICLKAVQDSMGKDQ
jgi:hypothetical protein